MKKDEAIQKLQNLINEKSKEGYEITFKNESKTILVDQSKNIVSYERSWDLFKGHVVYEQSINYEKLNKIDIVTLPIGLSSAYNEFSLGGLMTGGLTGFLIGSLIDDIRGPKRENISLNFEFKEKGWGEIIYYTAYFAPKVPMEESLLEHILKENIIPEIDKVKKLFSEKAKFKYE